MHLLPPTSSEVLEGEGSAPWMSGEVLVGSVGLRKKSTKKYYRPLWRLERSLLISHLILWSFSFYMYEIWCEKWRGALFSSPTIWGVLVYGDLRIL